MDQHQFVNYLSVRINKYIRLSEMMLSILSELKESLLLFDTAKLNRVLDEKLVLSEELLVVNNEINNAITEKYGEFNEEATQRLIAEFPVLKVNWETLREFIKNIKMMLNDIKRVLVSIESYNETLLKNVNVKKKTNYSYAARYSKHL